MRTAPKFLFELSEREANILLLAPPLQFPDAKNLVARLTQFVTDCQEKPLTEEESDEIGSWWKDTDATDLVSWNLPPGQQRREYLAPYGDEEDAAE